MAVHVVLWSLQSISTAYAAWFQEYLSPIHTSKPVLIPRYVFETWDCKWMGLSTNQSAAWDHHPGRYALRAWNRRSPAAPGTRKKKAAKNGRALESV